jgi:DNA polymerase I
MGGQRELFKSCILAVQYGMEVESLALRVDQPVIIARDLLRSHRETYKKFWRWSDACVDQAMLYGSLQTVFGWHVRVGSGPNPRSLRNFPMQGNGAEMLRLACCLITERGIGLCAPVHDAVLICAPLARLREDIELTQAAMAEASRIVLAGFQLRTEAKIIQYPNRYMDVRGAVMWDRVCGLIGNEQE